MLRLIAVKNPDALRDEILAARNSHIVPARPQPRTSSCVIRPERDGAHP